MTGKINRRATLPAGLSAVAVLLVRLVESWQTTRGTLDVWPAVLQALGEAAFAGGVAWCAFAYYRRRWCIVAAYPVVEVATLHSQADGSGEVEFAVRFELTAEPGVGGFDVLRGTAKVTTSGDGVGNLGTTIDIELRPAHQESGRTPGEPIRVHFSAPLTKARWDFLTKERPCAYCRLDDVELVTDRGVLQGAVERVGLDMGHPR